MNIVVVGGGFGGVKAALELSKRQVGTVTLISNESYFLHHATLYATATGRDLAESVIPLNDIFIHHPNVTVVYDTAVSVDERRRLLNTEKGSYRYDKLVLALGSVTTYFGIKGMDEHSYGIKTLDEIRAFKDHIHDELVRQKFDKEYFVIGAGPTGVELAGALQEYLQYLISVHRLKKTKTAVTLVEAAPRILPRSSTTCEKHLMRRFKKVGIRVFTNHKVESLSEDTIVIDGKSRPTTTAIWTSGVANSPFFAANADVFQLAPNGRVDVNPFLEGREHVYVIGDNNTVRYSGLAWSAMHQATFVATDIARITTRRTRRAFKPKTFPNGVPVGENWGYVEWKGVYVSGRTGFIVRRLMELAGYWQLIPFKNAVAIWRAHDIAEVDR